MPLSDADYEDPEQPEEDDESSAPVSESSVDDDSSSSSHREDSDDEDIIKEPTEAELLREKREQRAEMKEHLADPDAVYPDMDELYERNPRLQKFVEKMYRKLKSKCYAHSPAMIVPAKSSMGESPRHLEAFKEFFYEHLFFVHYTLFAPLLESYPKHVPSR